MRGSQKLLLRLHAEASICVQATVYAAARVCSVSTRVEGPFSVGPPSSNSRLYVLDKQLQPVPIGVPGELHISGVSLARGYLNRPAESAKSFIANPFCSEEPYDRLYKTGDLARWLPDGTVHIVGRVDSQVPASFPAHDPTAFVVLRPAAASLACCPDDGSKDSQMLVKC